MQTKIITLIFCLAAILPAGGQDLSVGNISASLIAESPDIIIRVDDTIFEVENIDRATTKVRRVFTIFNEKGREHAGVRIQYSDLSELGSVKGALYNAEGRKIRSLRDRDETDFAVSSGLYSDTRQRNLEMASDEYPYTVEYEYTMKNRKGHMFWPRWVPASHDVATQSTSLTIITTANYPFRYKNYNFDIEPLITNHTDETHYVWRQENVLPIPDREPYGPGYLESTPFVITGPTTFQLGGYRGDLTSWEEFGKWYDMLKQGRGKLPTDIKTEIQEVVKDASTKRDSIRVIYQYLQNKTRYISVQLGIGGFQPFDAQYVAERQYGDCKALSNYLQALLLSVGIESHQALIKAGSRRTEITEDFSTSQFNHAILAVPAENDTIWLDGTSQTLPFGHVYGFIHDRFALLTKPDGGELVRTPKLTYQENVTTTSANIVIDDYGDAKANIAVVFEGLYRDRPGSLANESDQTRERWLHNWINASSFTVDKVDYSSIDNHDRDIELPLVLTLPNYATETGSRVFIKAFPFESGWDLPRRISNRQTDIVFGNEFSDVDSATVHYPNNMVLESAPDDMEIETDFAKFTFHVEVDQEAQTITSFRSFELFKNRMPAERYKELRNMIKKIRRADRSKVIFKTNS